MTSSKPVLLLLVLLGSFLVVSCQPTSEPTIVLTDSARDINNGTAQSDSKTLTPSTVVTLPNPTPTPLSTVINTPTSVSTATPEYELPSPTNVGLGRLYFARPQFYGWFDLVAQATQHGLVLDSGDGYHRFTSQELNNGPGDHRELEFSNYSDLVAYSKGTSTTAEIWLSDVAYGQPEIILMDTESRFTDSETMLNHLTLEWSPDDSHLFLIHDSRPEVSLVYHLADGSIENWYWNCDSIILSPQSGRLALLCPRVPGAEGQQLYAVLEWGGEIWFADTPPAERFLASDTDGTQPWAWSPDGQWLAYYDPSDVDGRLFVTDAHGNSQGFFPGISVYSDLETDVSTYDPQGDLLFLWAQDAPILLVKGYGLSGKTCPPVETTFNPNLLDWPCWQVVDLKKGEIIWNEADLVRGNGQTEESGDSSRSWIDAVAVEPDGRAIAIYSFEPDRRIVVVDLQTGRSEILNSFDAVNALYWTAATTRIPETS